MDAKRRSTECNGDSKRRTTVLRQKVWPCDKKAGRTASEALSLLHHMDRIGGQCGGKLRDGFRCEDRRFQKLVKDIAHALSLSANPLFVSWKRCRRPWWRLKGDLPVTGCRKTSSGADKIVEGKLEKFFQWKPVSLSNYSSRP